MGESMDGLIVWIGGRIYVCLDECVVGWRDG